jgi:hypothetical protein
MKYDVSIDKNNLDEESIHLPALFDMFSTKESEASEELDLQRDRLKVIEADVALDIRGWPIQEINIFFDLDLPKLTEEVYKQLVQIHPDTIRVKNKIAEARYELKIYSAARKSIEAKAAALDRLAKLHGQGYFMKVEGRPYKTFSADAVLKRVKRAVLDRRADDGAIPPAPKIPKNKAPERKRVNV